MPSYIAVVRKQFLTLPFLSSFQVVLQDSFQGDVITMVSSIYQYSTSRMKKQHSNFAASLVHDFVPSCNEFGVDSKEQGVDHLTVSINIRCIH